MVIASKASQTRDDRARRAGSPRRPARRGSRRRPSARGSSARAAPTRRSAGAAVEDPLADDRVPAHERPLVLVERAGLVRGSRRGSRSCRRRAARRRGATSSSSSPSRPSSRPTATRQRRRRRAGGRAGRARARRALRSSTSRDWRPAETRAVALVRVHAPVGELQRLGRRRRPPSGSVDDAVRASSTSKPSPCSRSAPTAASTSASAPAGAGRRAARRTRRRRAGRRRRAPATAAASRSPSRASSASPAGWPKASLYSLKPSRSKSTSARGSLARGARQRVLEVGHQAAAVAQPGERVRERLAAAVRQHALVLDEHEGGSHQHQQQRHAGEGHRQPVEAGEVVIRQQPDGANPAHDRDDHHPQAVVLEGAGAPDRLPGSQADEQRRGRPQRVHPGVVVPRPVGCLDEVDGVADGVEGQAEPEHEPRAPGVPAGEPEDRDDHAQQEQVADGVGEARDHGGAQIAGAALVDDRAVGEGGGECCRRHGADQAVQPQARPRVAQARPHQQHERDESWPDTRSARGHPRCSGRGRSGRRRRRRSRRCPPPSS